MVRAIPSEDESRHNDQVVYTPSAATRTLPLVRRVVKDLLGLHQAIDAQKIQLKGIEDLPETIDQAAYRDELHDIKSGLDEHLDRVQDCVDELRSLGVEPSDPFDGHVGFPAMLNRRRIFLCWQPDDEAVEYWREVDEPASERKKIDTAMSTNLAT